MIEKKLSLKNQFKSGKIIPCLLTVIFIIMSMKGLQNLTPERMDYIHSPPPNASQSQGLTDLEELKTFLDDFISNQLEKWKIAGMTLSIVKDGEIFFTNGYGFSDVENSIPVIANETLFRVGSISKLFVATAVMQLVEQGTLDLHTDINTYLTTFQIPEKFSEAITLDHLLTHTAGFEDTFTPTILNSADALESLDELLTREMPKQVRPPGKVPSYSNFGITLAGYIVEQVSGKSFEQYVEDEILNPLGMEHSTFRQPLPNDLSPKMSKGYHYIDNVFIDQPFEIITVFPVGSLSATATDMAKFMIAHLNNGIYDGNRILQVETAQEMHSQHFTVHPQLPGMCYGFYETNFNNQSIISHDGDTILFHSSLVLLPEHNLGFFVSYNSYNGYAAYSEFLSTFLDRYFPAPSYSTVQPLLGFEERVHRFTGNYLSNRRPYVSFDKAALILDYDNYIIKITANPNGTIQILEFTFVEVEPLLFREVTNQYYMLAFIEDDQGHVTHVYIIGGPILFDKLQWYESSIFQNSLFVFCAIIFLSALIIWPIGVIRNRLRRKERAPPNFRRARWVAGGESLLNALFVVLMFVIMLNQTALGITFYPILTVVLILPIISCAFTAATTIFSVLAWWGKGNLENKPYWSIWGRLHYTLITLAGLFFIWYLIFWNLLGFNF